MKRKRLLQNLFLSLVTVVIMAFALEVGYRVYLYFRLQDFVHSHDHLIVLEQPLFQFDERIGFRHYPNATMRFAWVNREGEILSQHEVVTNSAGWVSRNDYTEAKAADEFRMVVLGDSLTANNHNSITWVDELADLLNADAELKAHLGVETISAYSFGQEGTGIVQFQTVYEEEASQYNPDLVLANFIREDIPRPFKWRHTYPLEGDYAETVRCFTPSLGSDACALLNSYVISENLWNDLSQVDVIWRDSIRARVNALPWFSPHSELLARFFGDRKLAPGALAEDRMEFRNYRRRSSHTLEDNIAALQAMNAQSPAFLALYMYGTEDAIVDEETNVTGRELAARLGETRLVFMGDYTPDVPRNEEYYHVPYDPHPKDVFVRMYAQAVYEMLTTDYWGIR